MNEPPQESMFIRYLLENPWPLGLFFIGVAVVLILIWVSRGGGGARLPLVAGGALVIGASVFILANIVTTPGEHARMLVKRIVAHAVDGDPDEIIALLAPNATLHLQSLRNPGQQMGDLEESIRSLEKSNRISENTITKLRAWTTSSESAIVFLGCRTSTNSTWTPVPSTWVMEVERSEGDEWRVKRIAFASLAGQPPDNTLR